MRTSARAVFAGAVALLALVATLPLGGCGSGSRKSVSQSAVSRQKGTVTLTVVWPEQTRLIPQAANSITVRLARTPDTEIPEPTPVPAQTLTRPAPGQPLTTTATFTDLELGSYTIEATAYPGPNGAGVINPITGANVPLATRTVMGIRVQPGVNTAPTVTMESTIARSDIRPDPVTGANLFVDAQGRYVLYTGNGNNQSIDFEVRAFDNTPSTATPPGPYRVLVTNDRMTVESLDPTIATATKVVTAQGVLLARVQAVQPGTARLRITDTESGNVTTIPIVVAQTGIGTFDPANPGRGAAQWAKFKGDTLNAGRALFGPVAQGTDLGGNWPFPTGSRIVFSSPAIAADGTVYIGTITRGTGGDRTLYAINPDGSRKWAFNDNGQMGDIEASPTLGQDGTIYIASMNGIVYALRDNGQDQPPTVVWQYNTGRPVFASVALANDNNVFIATEAVRDSAGNITRNSIVVGLNGFNGQVLRVRNPDDPNGALRDFIFTEATGGIHTTPALSPDGGTLYVATQDGVAFGIRTGFLAGEFGGTRRWRNSLNSGAIEASPTVGTVGGQTVVFFATLEGKLFALNPFGGAFWAAPYDAAAQIYTTPTLRNEGGNTTVVYIATLDNTSGTFDHKVVAVNAANGTEIWRTPVLDEADIDGDTVTDEPFFSDGFTSSPALSADGTALYLGNFNGNIYAIDADPANTNPVHGLVSSFNGGRPIVTPAPEPGEPINNIESSPAVDAQGRIFIGGYDGRVYAIR